MKAKSLIEVYDDIEALHCPPIVSGLHTIALCRERDLAHGFDMQCFVAHLDGQRRELFEAVQAGVAYFSLLLSASSDDPANMSEYGNPQGDTLDTLFDQWVTLSKSAMEKAGAKP